MTVSNTDSPVKIYTGTATEYPIPFDYISDDDILVTLYNTTTGAATDQTIDVDYTIVEETVTYSEEPGAEYNVVIRRVTECTQEASFGPGEAPPLSTHESAFDKLTMLAQDLDERLSRCVILPDSYSGEDFTLPDLTTNAGRLLRINEDGTGLDVLAVSDSGQATEVTEYVTTDELSQLHESGVVKADLVKLHAITSTHTEINQLHESGVMKADLEKLHALTSTHTEINQLHESGVVKADFEKLHDITVEAAVINADKPANKGADITVTVGAAGDYATINAALAALSKYYPLYVSGGFTAEISLLTGFTMAEQVLVQGVNLSWVRITSEDAIVTIQRSALTISYSSLYPAFGASSGALPYIDVLFSMDASGAATGREGLFVGPGGTGVVATGCGVRNAGGNGINCTSGMVFAARSDFRNAGRTCAFADYGGMVVVTGATLSGGGVYGVYAGNGSNIIADLANCQRGGSPAATDINTYMGSRVTALNATGGLSQTANTLTSHGIIFR